MNRNIKNTNGWLWLTVPISILTVFAAGTGLFFDSVYSASPRFVLGQAVGQDLVTLAVALPVLIVSAILASRGSQRGHLIWVGILVYLTYNYLFTLITVRFNVLFLVYVALLGCSLYALIGGLATMDFGALKENFSEKTPLRATSIFLALMCVLFYLVWFIEIIPATIVGELPRMVSWNETPTSAFYVLDMAWILPAVGLTAVWLWRRRAVGYVLAGALLTTFVVEEWAVMSEMIMAERYGHPFPVFPEIAIYIIFSVVTLGWLIWYLKGLRQS